MTCANCDHDFREYSEDNREGGYTQQNYHMGRPFRQFGYSCPNCGFHNTVFSITVKVPFVRSARTYDRLDKIVEKFKDEVIDFYKTKGKPIQFEK
jgi:rubredoxin